MTIMREKRRLGELKTGDWCWVQDYDCPICSTQYAVGFLTEDAVLSSVECENCGWDMIQVPAPAEETNEA